MDLRTTDIQDQLCSAFRDFLEDQCPTTRVREAEPLGFDSKLWNEMLAMDTVALGVPEDHGGAGAGLLDVALVGELMGRHLAPVPFTETAVAARCLAAVPNAPDVLAGALAGQRIVTLALHPSVGGMVHFVPAAAVADDVIALRGDDLVLVPLSGATPRSSPANVGSLPLADCQVDGAGAVTLVSGDAARDVHARAVAEWKVLTAAQLAGMAGRAFEIVLEYVKIRRAFGMLLGAFQTVGHRLADNRVRLDGATFLTREAAWTRDENLADAPAFASAAFAYSTETAFQIAGDALHMHGGIGYTVEHDAQLFYRRAKAWPLVYGDARREYRAVARQLKAWRES